MVPNAANETEIEVQSRLAIETLMSMANAAEHLSELQPVDVNDLPEDPRTCIVCQAAEYLSELQPVDVNDLPEDSRTCIICQEIYNTGDEPEQAYLVGRCGHVLGRACLFKWVMPEGCRPNNTCPFCRAVLFEDDIPDLADALVDNPRELLGANIELLEREASIEQLLGVQAYFHETIQLICNDRARLDENEEWLLDLWKAQLDVWKQILDLYKEILDLYNGLNERESEGEENEREFEGEEYDRVCLNAFAATDRALDVWAEIWEHQRERAGVGIAGPPFLFSEYVLTIFRRYVHGNNVARRPARPATYFMAVSLRHMMTVVCTRLHDDMVGTAMPLVWTENGPPLTFLLDPATMSLTETALERLVDIERQRYETDIPPSP